MSKNLAKIVKIFTFLCPHTYMWYIYVCSYTGVLSYHICVYNYVVGLSFLFFSFLCFLALFLANKVRFASYFDFHISWG